MIRMNKRSQLIPGAWVFDREREEPTNKHKINYSNLEVTQLETERHMDTDIFEEKNVRESLAEMTVQDKESPFKIMRENPIIFINLMIIMLSWLSTSFNNYLLSFSIRNFGGNLYYNSWAFGFAGVAGKILASVLRNYMPTKIGLLSLLVLI